MVLRVSLVFLSFALLVSCATTSQLNQAQNNPGKQVMAIAQPLVINKEGLDFQGTTNLLLVPENRSNPKSRLIPVHYFRFPAKSPSGRPPIFYLPGGPGGYFDESHFYEYYKGPNAKAWTTELTAYNKSRDIIIVNQRGNHQAPGLGIPNFNYRVQFGEKDSVLNIAEYMQAQAKAINEAVEDFEDKGVDVSGYDIINIVEDLEAIRQYHQYDKIALVGTSFGSQWGLGYMQRYPKNVDRALFSGLEPLDHARDDPQGVWSMFERLAQYAKNDTRIVSELPEVSLTEALKTVFNRLSHHPVQVEFAHPKTRQKFSMEIGPDDLRVNLEFPFAKNRRHSLEVWPKYISELYRGDYRCLALWAWEERGSMETEGLLAPLIDNSLGISERRKNILLTREESEWVATDLSLYSILHELAPTKDVGDHFRNPEEIDIPVLIIHGDLDRNTPIENAYYLLPYLKNGYLAEIKTGTHGAKRELIVDHPQLANRLFQFMDLDLDKEGIDSYYKSLPDEYVLRSIQFQEIFGESLFEMISNGSFD